jgi:hypothetical protein
MLQTEVTRFDNSLDSIREGQIDPEMGLVPLDSLKRFHPYRRDPTDDRIVHSFSSRHV